MAHFIDKIFKKLKNNFFVQRWAINFDYGVGKLEYGGFYHDEEYSGGKNLSSTARVYNIVKKSVADGNLPNDENGIYLVLGSRFKVIIINYIFLESFCIYL